MYRNKKVTALDNLSERYRRFSTIGMIMVVCSLSYSFIHLPFREGAPRYALSIIMMVYFACCSAIDWWLHRGVASIDCFTMSVREVAEKALYYRKKHLQSMMFLFPFAAVVVGVMVWCFDSDSGIIIGMVAGILVGVLIGYRQFRRFMEEYKVVTKE